MMLRYIFLLVVACLANGCATHWEHDTKLHSEFKIDDQECQLISGGAYQSVEPGRGERQSYENCMWERGWRKTNVIWFFDPKPK
jgi:hypothetical protein